MHENYTISPNQNRTLETMNVFVLKMFAFDAMAQPKISAIWKHLSFSFNIWVKCCCESSLATVLPHKTLSQSHAAKSSWFILLTDQTWCVEPHQDLISGNVWYSSSVSVSCDMCHVTCVMRHVSCDMCYATLPDKTVSSAKELTDGVTIPWVLLMSSW
mgnify:CR=1 FL=1